MKLIFNDQSRVNLSPINDPAFKEFAVEIVDQDGQWQQDIAIVRLKDDQVELLVYADEFDEDYTHAFTIKKRPLESL